MNRYPLPVTLIILSLTFILACDKDEEEVPGLVNIEYTLSSLSEEKHADIEYTSGFGQIRLEDEPLPWSISFNAIFEQGDAISFKAESGDQGEMSGQILIDEEEVASESATHLIQLEYIKGLK